MTRSFGEIIIELRKAKGLKQQDLAEVVSHVHRKRVGPSTISRIEQNAVAFSSLLGLAIIKALDPGPAVAKELKQALTQQLENFELPTPYTSGPVLDKIMADLSMNNRVLADRIGKVHQGVQAWRAGSSLMSDDMLGAVTHELGKAGAKKDQIEELIRSHIYDVLMTLPRLTYLTKNQRKKLAETGAALI